MDPTRCLEDWKAVNFDPLEGDLAFLDFLGVLAVRGAATGTMTGTATGIMTGTTTAPAPEAASDGLRLGLMEVVGPMVGFILLMSAPYGPLGLPLFFCEHGPGTHC